METFTAEAKDRALRAVFGGAVWLALTSSGREEADGGYHRQLVAFGQPEGDGERRYVTNALEVRFPQYLENANAAVDGWAVMTAQVGGEALASGRMKRPILAERGEELAFAAGAFRVGIE